jgi:hypothetical protein
MCCRAAWITVIPVLVDLINCDDIVIQRAACVILRSASYGSSNAANKVGFFCNTYVLF